jgi:hypothetical protein
MKTTNRITSEFMEVDYVLALMRAGVFAKIEQRPGSVTRKALPPGEQPPCTGTYSCECPSCEACMTPADILPTERQQGSEGEQE